MNFLDSLEDLPNFLDQPAPTALMIPVVQLDAGQVDPRLSRLSYSGLLDLHACPRKYQLNKLQAERGEQDISTSVTFAYGHAMGEGIQQFLIHRDKQGSDKAFQTALWKMFLAWDCDLLDENHKQKKSFLRAVAAILQFKSMSDEGLIGEEWEVAEFNGKPAAELGFKIDLGDGFYYRGYVDLVLRNKYTGEYLILELKTSSATYINHYSYKNSAQAIGYSVVLDTIAPGVSSYGVQYLVYMTRMEQFEAFDFPKSFRQRVQWLQDVIWDKKQIQDMEAFYGADGIWQVRGESCCDFGRVCDYMDICGLETKSLVSPLLESQLVEDKVYDFNFTLQELLT
jgi:hypothetical protein